jgi:hypothetical protein
MDETNFNFLPDDILNEISSYLTIHENYQLLFVIKDIKIQWSYLQKRDFPNIKLPLTKYNAIHLDNGNIISHDVMSSKSFKNFCKKIKESYDHDNDADYSNELISKYICENNIASEKFMVTKTEALSKFKLPKDLLLKIKPVIRVNPYCEDSYMYLYPINYIQILASAFHFGLTNLKLKLNMKKENKSNDSNKSNKSICSVCLKSFAKKNIIRHIQSKHLMTAKANKKSKYSL